MKALLVVDAQNDFAPGGALAASRGNEIIPIINRLMEKYPLIIATKDWHPKNHISFAANHPGKKVGDIVKASEIDQILWPDHCVQNTHGSEFVPGLDTDKIEKIFYKGTDPLVDDYSAFFDNAKKRKTGVEEYLKSKGIREIAIVGFVTDYCVLYSVRDAIELGFEISVIKDACCPINLQEGDEKKALREMKRRGAKILVSKDVL